MKSEFFLCNRKTPVYEQMKLEVSAQHMLDNRVAAAGTDDEILRLTSPGYMQITVK